MTEWCGNVPPSTPDSGNNNVRVYGYSYDAANNLTGKTRTVTSPASSDAWAYTYDNANEQLSVSMNGGTAETRTYDAWGRMATRTQGTSSATFGYRYGGKLYSYATNFAGEAAETMQYRGDMRLYSRVSGATTKVYRYDRGWNAINEEDGTGALTASSVYAPTSDVGERLAYMYGALSNGLAAYAYHDQLGSTRAWRWFTKALAGRNEFAPYGEKISGYDSLPRDYALHVQDPYTLCYHAPYREYAAGWARWTTRDPMGMVDGPNMFAYVRGNPVGAADVLGLWGICMIVGKEIIPLTEWVEKRPHCWHSWNQVQIGDLTGQSVTYVTGLTLWKVTPRERSVMTKYKLKCVGSEPCEKEHTWTEYEYSNPWVQSDEKKEVDHRYFPGGTTPSQINDWSTTDQCGDKVTNKDLPRY